MFKFFLVAFIWISSFSALAQGQRILGLNFGSPLTEPIAKCSQGRNEVAEYCSWSAIDPTSPASEESVFPPINPTKFSVPSWLVNSVPMRLRFHKSGALIGITAPTTGPASQTQVLDSVKDRFGPPTTHATREAQNAYGAKWAVETASWRLSELIINFDCASRDRCYLSFKTPELDAADTAAFIERRNKDKL